MLLLLTFNIIISDADNRLTVSYTSRDAITWEKESKNFYYATGQLLRLEVGDKIVQATDYAYTAQGWIKGMNAGSINAQRDIGKDAYADGLFSATSQNRDVALDAAGFVLGYYDAATGIKRDYWSSAFAGQTTAERFVPLVSSTATLVDYNSLYNGNISHMITALSDEDENVVTNQVTAYKYDQLNRIKQVRAHRNFNVSTNAFTGSTGDNGKYHEDFSYDRNGNILNVLRNGNNTGGTQVMDNFTYHYYDNTGAIMIYGSDGWPGNATNKLAYVADVATASNYTTDIDDQTSASNYEYDGIGNLVSDESEEILKIDWLANGKIKSITRISTSTKSDLEFVYNAMGNRIEKIVKPRSGSGVRSQQHWTHTYYVRNGNGDVLAVYERKYEADAILTNTYHDKLKLMELDIYSGKRMGVLYADTTVTRTFYDTGFTDADGNVFTPDSYDPVTPPTPCTDHCVTSLERTLGHKAYEISNHLGNVLATVSDRRRTVDNYSYAAWSSGTKYKYDAYLNVYYEDAAGTFQRTASTSDLKVDWYTADVLSYSDYYAFGAAMDGRSYQSGSYRYQFQGQEEDPELWEGAVSYKYRVEDPRLGRFFSVDPLASAYPANSTYAFSENRVTNAVELEGLEAHDLANGKTQYGPWTLESIDAYNLFETEYCTGCLGFEDFTNDFPDAQLFIDNYQSWQGAEMTESEVITRNCLNCLPVAYEMAKSTGYKVTMSFSAVTYKRPDKASSVGESGLGESFIPVWGSGRDAINDFQNGRYLGGTFNTALAVTDVFLIRSLGKGVVKGITVGVKGGVEQYSLRAAKNGYYPVMRRGFSTPQGSIFLNKGDVWKYGITKNPTTRYTQNFLRNTGAGFLYTTEASGTRIGMRSMETGKILNFKAEFGRLPAGNKIVR